MTEAAETAQRIADELKALPSRTVLTLRRARMRWSSALQAESPTTVLAVVQTLIRTINPRFVAYELVLHHPGALALVDQRVAERLAGDLCSWGDVDAFSTLIAGPARRSPSRRSHPRLGWLEQPTVAPRRTRFDHRSQRAEPRRPRRHRSHARRLPAACS